MDYQGIIASGNIKSILACLKNDTQFQEYVDNLVSPDSFFQRGFSQKIYHIIHGGKPEDHVIGGWYKKFKSYDDGYINKIYAPVYYDRLTDAQVLKYIKATNRKLTNVRCADIIKKATPYLDEYNASLTVRCYYLRNDISEPKLNCTGGLIPRPQVIFEQLSRQFAELGYSAKTAFLSNWYYLRDRERFKETQRNSKVNSIQTFIESEMSRLGLPVFENTIQCLYHIVNNINKIPRCKVCDNVVGLFKNDLTYATTCSHTCNNVYRENIYKRIKNNVANTKGYFTNVGANEQRILKYIKGWFNTRYDTFLYQQNICGYIVDMFIPQDKIVVEVNERHHLWSKQREKDILRYKHLQQNGYKIIVVLDNIPDKTVKKITSIFEYIKKLQDIGIVVFRTKFNDKKILTPNGFEYYKESVSLGEQLLYTILFEDGTSIRCTHDQKFYTIVDCKSVETTTEKLLPGVVLLGSLSNKTVKSVSFYKKEEVFDIVESVSNLIYVDDILAHQCLIIDEAAHIEPASILESFWRSVFPIVSSSHTAKIFMVSTPNGTGNLFHSIYSEAELGKNGWAYDKVEWDEVPGRDEKWKREQIAAMGSLNSYLQEFEAVFLDSGESSINEELFEKLKTFSREPKYVMEDGCYKIYDDPMNDRIYVAGVDTSEGVDKDYSVINIFDITDLTSIKQVAIYACNSINPHNFTTKVFEILTQWGRPLACIERNNQGTQVADNLRNIYGYENIVCWGASEAGRNKTQLGIISHTNTKYKGITNMRYWINTLQCVELRDFNTIKELKDFVRYPNGAWGAKRGNQYHDDRVMSLVWALVVLENEVVQRYFEVLQVDENKRPLSIRSLDYGIKYDILPNSMFNENDTSVTPFLMNGDYPGYGGGIGDVQDLQRQGWSFLR